MCGIFGIISGQGVALAEFRRLAELNKDRGNLGFGYLTADLAPARPEIRVRRYPEPFDPSRVPDESTHVALGHIRAPTASRCASEGELHPFESKSGYLAHNGLLLNHEQFPHWRLDSESNVDSVVLLGGVEHHLRQGTGTVRAILKTVEALDGQQACWYLSTVDRGLYLWRVMAPIYAVVRDRELRFSSVRSTGVDTLLEEGVIYRYVLGSSSLARVAEFSYYSPYRT